MGILRKVAEPVSITNTSGQPEIVLEIDGLIISMTPPGATPSADAADAGPDKADR